MRRPYPIPARLPRSNSIGAAPQRGARTAQRVSLVALQEEIQVPARQGSVAMRRLKVMRIEQTGVPLDSLMAAHSPNNPPRRAPKQIAPTRQRVSPPRQPEPPELECRLEGRTVRLRSVGEVMADEAGNFYELSGGQVRPLGELVRDEEGRMFEVRATSESPAVESAQPQQESDAGPGDRAREEVASKTASVSEAKTPSRPAPEQHAARETSRGYRKILADPGLYLKLPWSSIKGEMTTQVKHPEKLTDADEVECYAQIYEAQRTLPADQLAAAELGDGALHAHLHPLTPEKARMLGTPQLFKPTRYPFDTGAPARLIHSGQRVFRLWPLFDPTADRLAEPRGESAASSKNEVALRIEVPREYLNPTQFRHSREEVLYDMKGMLGTLPPEARSLARWFWIYPLRLVKALFTASVSRRRMKKWKAMVAGQEPDRQLWVVTPPRGFSYNGTVRSWAEHTLDAAGYDAERMLLEWEIFWRQRGWN